MKKALSLSVLASVLTAVGCGNNLSVKLNDESPKNGAQQRKSPTSPIKLSFVLTNDIHGHTENLAVLGGILKQMRGRAEYWSGEAGLLVLDSGDQFQGTLLSNYDEGETVFKVMNELGYDAVIPGNHDYDFGPIGWLYDQVMPGQTPENASPRQVIEKLAGTSKTKGVANFPLVSANTFYKASLKPKGSSAAIELDSKCQPAKETLTTPLDFEKGERPDFLKPYVIVKSAGVRVALIGIDHGNTTAMTTAANVSDLCFRNEVDAYVDVRKSLEGQADVFVMLIHNGNINKSTEASDITEKVNALYPNGVDLVAAGHTHTVHNANVKGVHVVQDGKNGEMYGRVDLYFDPVTKKVTHDQTSSWAGMKISSTECEVKDPKGNPDPRAAFICQQITLPVSPLASIEKVVADADAMIAPMAKKKIAVAADTLTPARVDENPLGNILSDALREIGRTDISVINAGGIRTQLKKGDVLYENFFEVSPFNNQAVIIYDMQWTAVKALILSAIQTCGKYGTLIFSGLKIQYDSADCDNVTQLYKKAELVRVETTDGTMLLFDKAQNVDAAADKTFSVTTLDYLATGSAEGASAFAGQRVDTVMGVARELMVDKFAKTIPTWNSKLDGRFKNLAAPVAPVSK